MQVYIGIYEDKWYLRFDYIASFYDDVFTIRQESEMMTNVMGIWAFLVRELWLSDKCSLLLL